MKRFFTYQAAVNDAWFDKSDYIGAIPTHAKGGLFENRGCFWKLGQKFLKPLRDKVACKHCMAKNNCLFQM